MAKTTAKTRGATAGNTMTDGVEKMTKGIESATAFGQENVEAVVESSKIAAKAVEGMTVEIAAYSKKSYEDGLAAMKTLSACKSPAEFVETQTALTKASVETFVGEAAKLQDMYAAAAKDFLAPLNARIAAAGDAVKEFRV